MFMLLMSLMQTTTTASPKNSQEAVRLLICKSTCDIISWFKACFQQPADTDTEMPFKVSSVLPWMDYWTGLQSKSLLIFLVRKSIKWLRDAKRLQRDAEWLTWGVKRLQRNAKQLQRHKATSEKRKTATKRCKTTTKRYRRIEFVSLSVCVSHNLYECSQNFPFL